MRLNLPSIASFFDARSARTQQDELIRAMIPVVSQDEAVPYMHLLAPDGGVWKVTVGNTGTLTTVKVQG
jgi:hypothetical protein